MRMLDFSVPEKPEDCRIIGQASPSAQALLLSEVLKNRQGFSLVVTPDMFTAERLQRNLRFFVGNDAVEIDLFPDWEILPYDIFSPHQDITSKRLELLSRLSKKSEGVLIVPVTTLLHRLPPKSHVHAQCMMFRQGDMLDFNREKNRLSEAGYIHVDTVISHGEFAVRGSLIDIFPMGCELPVRLDLFDSSIDTIRSFDPETQRTVKVIDSLKVLPAYEYPLTGEGIARFKSSFQQAFDVDYRKCPVYMDITKGMASPGAEYYLPLFFEKMDVLFDYLPEDTLIITTDDLHSAAERFWSDTRARFENHKVDSQRPLLVPDRVLLPVDGLFGHFKCYPQIRLLADPVPEKQQGVNLDVSVLPDVKRNPKKDKACEALENFIDHDKRILFVAESAGRKEHLLEMLDQAQITPVSVGGWKEFIENETLNLAIAVAPLEDPLWSEKHRIAMITESQLLGRKVMQRRHRKKTNLQSDQVIRHLSELKSGAPVVHLNHGVGRYEGLQTLTPDGIAQEFLTLVYADDAKLYVPVSNLHMISRYTGASDSEAPLHRLGSEQWQKARKKASEKVHDVAVELLDIHARREMQKGEALIFSESDYLAFAEEFPFETTPDQQSAIEATLEDLKKEQPMDRLICGDVGFGKTEVAMRAAFAMASAGRQVAVLAPTTLLARQHFETFSDRFAEWPVTIDVISRFQNAGQTKLIKESVKRGKIDIIIGTHKLLDSAMEFKNLGLLVVDEEHRFGVRQKERMKAMRSQVDILTLTATPIPRTLNMAVASIRDLSIIGTPPAKRLSINTFIHKQDKRIVREAIMRELLRGGQVYYLHNDVKTIEKAADDLQNLLPEARIAIGHGQMRERELEQVMSDFYHKRSNILVCTTIIETGIDIPSANTIIITRADKFGLAQLHQLRGRVGRSHHQAYAYLLIPTEQKITTDAEKRLEAIASTTELGAGFMLATHDLEIRGAGELLGDEQSGQISSIGFSLYMDMLEKAVKILKKGEKLSAGEPLESGTEINLHVPALIPDSYIASPHTRLVLYKKMASCKESSELKELQIEMIDRFGHLPEPVQSLFRVSGIKLEAERLGVEKVEAVSQSGKIVFATNANIAPEAVIALIQSQPDVYQMQGPATLRFKADMLESEQRFVFTENLLKALKSSDSART